MCPAVDDLLCSDENLSVAFAPRDASLDPVEVIRLMAKREAQYGGCNEAYLQDIQRHGMEVMWRRKICRWMFETAKAFELSLDTVGCAVHIMDRYLSAMSVDKIMLQLVSMVSMYIASKMHEHQPISMDEMDLLSQRKFTRDDIRRVESQLLQILEWRLNPPASFTFARDFIQILQSVSSVSKLELEDDVMEFLQDVTEDYGSLRFQNSSIGIAAVHVVWNARKMRPGAVIQDAIHTLDVTGVEFVDCYRWLRELHHAKYQQPRFVSVEESKTTDPSRSISPTSVEEAAALCAADLHVEEEIMQEMLTQGKARAAATPEREGGSKRPRVGC